MIRRSTASCFRSIQKLQIIMRGNFVVTSGNATIVINIAADYEDLTSEASVRETIFTDLLADSVAVDDEEAAKKHEWMG